MHGLALTDDPLTEFVLHPQQLGRLALEQPAGRNTGPRSHHVGDIVGSDFFLQHDVGLSLGLGQRRIELLLDLGDSPVAQFSRLGQIAVTLGALGLTTQMVQLLLEIAYDVDGVLLVLPPRRQLRELLLLVGQFRAQLLQPVLGSGVFFLRERHFLDLKATNQTFHLVDLDRTGVDLHPQPRPGLVDEVDGLIRQEPAGDVAVRERGCRDQRGVGDPHAVVHLVAILQPAQDAHGVLHRGFADKHLLETAFQGGVLLDVLAIFLKRGRTDHSQFTAGQHRLDHVAGVHCTLAGRTRADDRMQFIDERDDLPGRVLDVIENGLEPFLELATVLRPGDHGPHVQGDDGLVAQALRHIAVDDALSQALDDRGLTDTGLTDEHRVVLSPAAEHLDDATDLIVAPDNRVKLALAGPCGQVGGVFLQRLIRRLGVSAGDPAATAHLDEGVAQCLR